MSNQNSYFNCSHGGPSNILENNDKQACQGGFKDENTFKYMRGRHGRRNEGETLYGTE